MGIELARTAARLAGYDVIGNWPYSGVLASAQGYR